MYSVEVLILGTGPKEKGGRFSRDVRKYPGHLRIVPVEPLLFDLSIHYPLKRSIVLVTKYPSSLPLKCMT